MPGKFLFMSESTEELNSAVRGLAEVLAEAGSLVERLSGNATELAEEAAGHGWHGMGARMQEAAGSLEAAAGQVGTGRQACETAAEELGLINDKIPAEEVVAHLATSTTQLAEAATALEGATEKAEEAQTAVSEIGQEGMMQATSDLHDQLTEIHDQIVQHQGTSESERVSADAYAKKQPGN
jgi:hypothetical protein